MYIYTLLVQSDTLEPKNICIKCSKVTFPTIFTPLQFILNSSAGAASSAASVRGEMEMFVRPSIVFILVSAVTQLSVSPGSWLLSLMSSKSLMCYCYFVTSALQSGLARSARTTIETIDVLGIRVRKAVKAKIFKHEIN